MKRLLSFLVCALLFAQTIPSSAAASRVQQEDATCMIQRIVRTEQTPEALVMRLKLKNTGNTTWKNGTHVLAYSWNDVSPDTATKVSLRRRAVRPRQSVVITLPLNMPRQAGDHRFKAQMVNGSGEAFGQACSETFHVSSPDSAASSSSGYASSPESAFPQSSSSSSFSSSSSSESSSVSSPSSASVSTSSSGGESPSRLFGRDPSDDKPPQVVAVVVNDGNVQRSRITSLTVTFSEVVTIEPDAFEIKKQGTDDFVTTTFTTQLIDGKTVATLTFSGDQTNYRSLSDGSYQLTVYSSKIHDAALNPLDGDADGSAGDDYIFGAAEPDKYFRFFGDSDGDRDVDLTDLAFFRRTFDKNYTDLLFNAAFDYDDDGDVDLTDRAEFLLRFNKGIGNDTQSPTVESVTLNDDNAQRSRVTSLTVTFSEIVTIEADAFSVTKRATDDPVTVTFTDQVVEDKTIATLTFSGDQTSYSSLSDGNYQLTVYSSKVHDTALNPLDGDSDGSAGGDYIFGAAKDNKYFRFFGDSDGDRDVDLTDLAFFRRTFDKNNTNPLFNAAFDYDNDGDVDLADHAEFLLRLNKTLGW